ncbi:vasopressin V2 receptor [Engraulis encrasicolus]|uniref:vasopressin V2 receptor n=1 Tax=Engraulis encrasicolus TaxID=184585 RepID=UPI002FCE9E18
MAELRFDHQCLLQILSLRPGAGQKRNRNPRCMEAVSGEVGWDGLAWSSSSSAAASASSSSAAAVVASASSGWMNLTSALFPGTATTASIPNGTHTTGGSHFWLLPDNGTGGGAQGTPAPPQARDEMLAQAEIAVLGLVLALTTLGNSFVLWVLLRRRKHNAPMHMFMVNLCVADLVVAFFQVLPQLVWDITERFQGPDALCRLVKYLQIVGMFASSYMIVAMTVDRHYAICCPLQAYRGGAVSRCNTPVLIAWALALVFSIPQVFIFSRSELAPGEFDCWGHFIEPWGLKAYITWMTLAVFVFPAVIITVCQVRIFREIHDNIYLKSERVVAADLKKNVVFFSLQSMKKEDERTGRGRASYRAREGRGGSGGGGGVGGGGYPSQKSDGSHACRPYCNGNDFDPDGTADCYDCPCAVSQYNQCPSSAVNHYTQCPNNAPQEDCCNHGNNNTTTTAPDVLPTNQNHSSTTSSTRMSTDLSVHHQCVYYSSSTTTTNAPDSPPARPRTCSRGSARHANGTGARGSGSFSCDSSPLNASYEGRYSVSSGSPYGAGGHGGGGGGGGAHAPLNSPPPPSVSRAMSKTVRMTLVIVLVYTICWSPFFIVQLWAAWDPNAPSQGVAFTILMLLASLNSCTNPWIYTAFSSSVSRELQALLRCRSRASRRGSIPDDSTATHTSTTKDSLY